MTETVTIDRLGAQGDGVTAAGLYVPFALPGETVRVVPQGDRARLVEVTAPARERQSPLCPHFGTCGGCALQHGDDRFVARWKRDLIHAALKARGIDGVEIRPMITSPPASRRRITATARRGKKGATIGFHAPYSDTIVPVSACVVAVPGLIDVLANLSEVVSLGASRKGEIRLTLTASDTGIDLAVTDAKPLTGPSQALLTGIAARAGLARIAWNGEVMLVRRAPEHIIGGIKVVPPPGGFLQPTKEGETVLIAAVTEALGESGPVADLFSGCGTFSLPLAKGREVHAADSTGPALEALDTAWRGAEGLRRITTERRDLFARPLMPAELKRFAAVVIDPPRAGARTQAEHLARSEVPRIVSVSCNPATFARDAKILLDSSYQLAWIQPVDQFRWSPHVELAACFSRRG